MDTNDDLYRAALLLHGHTCPAMPMGLRAGLAALDALGVERAADGQLAALVETDEDHCATCYADGIQMATGCTFGKGNIHKLGYGKFAVTVIDRPSGRSVRVVTRPETMQKSKESAFIAHRKKGTPASHIDPAVAKPLVDEMLRAPTEELFSIGEVYSVTLPPMRAHDFNTITCTDCGEVTVERYVRVRDGRLVCITCAAKA